MNNKRLPGIYPLINMIVFASFIGYVVENLFKLVMNGYVDNRYMFLPFLLGYGLFIAVIGIFMGTPNNLFPLKSCQPKITKPLAYLIYFAITVLLVSVGELALGYAVEAIGGFNYWDYSNLPLHFTKYTSLPTSVGFGAIITAFMGFIYEPSIRFFEKKKKSRVWRAASLIVISFLVIDFFISFAVMITTGKRMVLWRLHIIAK